MRVISKTISLLTNYAIKVDKTPFRNFAKALHKEHVTQLNQETLTGRILHYLNNDNEMCPNLSKNTPVTGSNLRQNAKNLRKFSTSEIVHFSSLLSSQKNIARPERIAILKELDTECCLRLPEMDSTHIFKLLNGYMKISSNRITEFKFYKLSTKALYDSLNNLSKKDLLQLIFYIGLKKKTIESQTMLRQCVKSMNSDFINNLTTEELCIICNSTFKTSTKITNKALLNKVRAYVNDHLSILTDCALFITLIKTIRHNRYQDENLLTSVSCATLFNKTIELYSFSTICHIMALFADYFYYDEQLFKIFVNKCMEQLGQSSFISKDTYLVEQPRGKDIKRFIWVLGMFSHFKLVDKNDIANVIIPKLIERIKAGEFASDVDSLIDITLYLWMLNYRPYELVPYVFTRTNSGTKPTTDLRLNLLLHSIYIEDPDLFRKLSLKLISIPSDVVSLYQLNKRPLVQRLLDTLNVIKGRLGLSRFQLSQEISHLNVIGITGYRNRDKAVYVEVLDDYTRLKNVGEDVPVGLMALKLRLLERSEEGLLTVSQKEIEEMTDRELSEYLLEEIQLIC